MTAEGAPRPDRPARAGSGPRTSFGDEAVRVYRLLRLHPGWPADRVAGELETTTGAVEDGVEELRRLGLVTDSPSGMVALTPHDAVVRLVSQQAMAVTAALDGAQDLGRALDDLLPSLPRLHVHAQLAGQIELIEGGAAVADYLGVLADMAQTEIIALHPGVPLTPEMARMSLELDRDLLARGVALRGVYLTSAARNLGMRSYLGELDAMGAEVRLRDTLPFRMILVDGSVGLCSMRWAEGRSGAVVVRCAPVLHLLQRLFDVTWTDASPPRWNAAPRATDPDDVDELSTEQRTLLRLLAEGATDQAIARTLGVTARTVTRKLREAFDVLGVQTRFQAGAEARARGLL